MKKLLTLLFAAFSSSLYAQSWSIVNTSDLETDNNTTNVHVVNNLGIGIYPNSTDKLSVSQNILMDVPNDADFNNIHTTSVNYGLRLSAGTDDATSSSIKLYGSSHATFNGGIGFTAYTDPNVSGNSIGFKFCHYVNNTSSEIGLVYIMKSGEVGIGTSSPNEKLEIMNGDLAITRSADDAIRMIKGYSLLKGIQLCANTSSNDGPWIGLVAKNNTTNPGSVGFTNYGASSKFSFYKYDPAYTTPLFEQLQIQNNGNISMLKRNDGDYRQIEAHSLIGRLSIHSNYTSDNGTTIELWGNNHEDKPGQIHFIDYNTAGEFDFLQYRPSLNQQVQQVQIDGNGNIWMTRAYNEPEWRVIGSRTQYGALALRSNMNNNDGSGVELYGPYHASNPGQMHLIDYGNSGEFQFIRYEPSTAQFRKQIVFNTEGDIYMYKPQNDALGRNIKAKTTYGGLTVGVENVSDPAKGAHLEIYGDNITSDPVRSGAIRLVSEDASHPNDEAVNIINHTTTWTSLMRVYKNGKVAIGADNMSLASSNYKLFVETGIMTERVRVAIKNSQEWADHVFSKEYKLMPINEVSKYIEDNKHLPGIPSADEVVKNGVDLGSMDAKLLQKIEELTLYVAQQQREIEVLKTELKK